MDIKSTYNSILKKILGNIKHKKEWKGAITGGIIIYFCLAIYIGINTSIGFGKPLDMLISVIGGLIILILSILAVIIVYILGSYIPPIVIAVSTSVIGILTYFIYETLPFTTIQCLIISVGIILPQVILGGVIYKLKKVNIIKIVALVIIVGLNIFLIYFIYQGHFYGNKNNDHTYTSNGSSNTPDLNGQYDYDFLTYGSGKDKRRIEYAQEADIITNTVSAAPYMGSLEGIDKIIRDKYWGFNRYNVPLNGRVFYPSEEGKFPLVFIVHGNHDMIAESEKGYDYLCEMLASKGYIAVSVDENFINANISGGASGGNNARAWLLLKHIEQWKRWSNDATNPFYNKIDMNNIALIGHSRGGEAVALAALFNKLDYYPGDGDIRFNFDFNIKSVVAIAPTDGQYKPTGKLAAPKNIDYLLLQGAYDGDVDEYLGSRLFDRIKYDDGKYHFKSSVYIEKANHGQFNSVWGNEDSSFPENIFINKKELLSQEAQQKIAKVYIAAFLDYTLKGESEYLRIFENHKNAEEWLPKTKYISRFSDSNLSIIADFDEDVRIDTTTLQGGKIHENGIYHWREKEVKLRDGENTYNTAVFLQWRNSSKSEEYTSDYKILLPKEFDINEYSHIVFDIAHTGKEFEDNRDNIDFSLKIEDVNGETSQINCNDINKLWKVFRSKFTRFPWSEASYDKDYDSSFQTYVIPINNFKNNNIDFTSIKSISFVFGNDDGEVMIDNIGFRREPEK